ncbi:Nif11-like leader peptide family natural product precursor [Mesorhizobium mediterraneum]|uniref:Nif11-like leader peptide family natural product precursor n=1 Tax=Mesorhizobium mediterraneum TaxID=43617 RepID=UPI00177DC458|nr:Nif11-like leader peptide family natural product precursor [Mesorhizobium mediterraneum]
MPRTDLERFVNDLGKKGSLLERLKQRAGGLASIVAIGKSLDYNITLDEVKSYIRSNSRQKPSSKKLGAITGRKRGSSASALTSLVQTTALPNFATDVPMSPVQVREKASVAAVVIVVVVVVFVAT